MAPQAMKGRPNKKMPAAGAPQENTSGPAMKVERAMDNNDLKGAQGPVFATIKRNRGEELRVGLSSLNGRSFLDLRIWYPAEDGLLRPSKKGVTCRLDQLPDLQAALASAIEFARREGLLAP
jgi:hypothetical protein